MLNVRVEIRLFEEPDWPAVWAMWHDIAASADTYDYPPDSTESDGREFWLLPSPAETWVGVVDGEVLGTYHVSPNRVGNGDHVANGSYMVASAARGRGVGRALVEHSLVRARELGYSAMQFNAVVVTNASAVRLYRSLGFIIVGTIPNGFRHRELGMVDFHIMHRFL